MRSKKEYKFTYFKIFKAFLNCILNFIRCIPKGYIDFLYIPFDPNKPLPENALNKFESIVSNLDTLNINYLVTDGTILGLFRDGYLIKHDNDIDIALLDSRELVTIMRYFFSQGWNIVRILIKNFHIYQIIFYKDGIILDFCNWKKVNNQVYFYAPEINGLRIQSFHYYLPKRYNFAGIDFFSHPNLREWIIEHYGKDWNIPKEGKGNWQDDCNDIVKIK